jgi:hypothetical protein
MTTAPIFRGNPIHEMELKVNVDDASSTVTYVGKAVVTASNSDPVWMIKKLTTTGTVLTITYANGNDFFDSVWNDRASLSYS